MNSLWSSFKNLFTNQPTIVYTYYADIDNEEWIKQGKPSIKYFLETYGASKLFGPNQIRPDGCVGVEKGWKVVMRLS